MENLIAELSISGSSLSDLHEDLRHKMELAESFKKPWTSSNRDWTDAYFMNPETEEKMDPWPGASNLYLPLIRVGVDGLLAQFQDAMFSNSPFIKVQAAEDQFAQEAEDLTRYYGEFFYTKQIPFRRIGGDYLWDALVSGTAVMKDRLNTDQMMRRRLISKIITKRGRPSVAEQAVGLLGDLIKKVSKVEKKLIEETFIEESRQIILENTSPEQIFVPPFAGPSMQWPECPWYYEKHYLTWNQLMSRKRAGYILGDEEELKKNFVEHPATEQQEAIAEALEFSSSRNMKTIEVCEFYMRLPMPADVKYKIRGEVYEKLDDPQSQKFLDKEGWEEEVVVSYLPQAKHIARIVPLDRIRADGKRPHVDMRYNRIPRTWFGEGVPASTLNLNKAENSFINQMVDYGTLQNLPWLLFQPSSLGDMPENMYLEPGALIPVADARGVQAPRFQGDPSFWISAIQMMKGEGERLLSVSDFTRGVSPTRPNAPETARATLALIGSSQVAFNWKTAEMAESFIDIFEHVHEDHATNMRGPVNFRFFNQRTQVYESRTLEPTAFKRPVNFSFILNPSRQSEQQVNQTLFSILAQPIIAAAGGDVGMQALRPLAKDLWESHGKDNFDEVWPVPVAQTAPVSQEGQVPGAPPPPQVPPQSPQVPPISPLTTNGNLMGQPVQTPVVPELRELGLTLQQLFTEQQEAGETSPFLKPEEEGANLPSDQTSLSEGDNENMED